MCMLRICVCLCGCLTVGGFVRVSVCEIRLGQQANGNNVYGVRSAIDVWCVRGEQRLTPRLEMLLDNIFNLFVSKQKIFIGRVSGGMRATAVCKHFRCFVIPFRSVVFNSSRNLSWY